MLLERISITKESVEQIESEVLYQRHIERYCLARKYLFGRVIDVACGVGYGSYLCHKNPDIISIDGFDIEAMAIAHAQQHFANDKIQFHHQPVEEITGHFDCLMSLETIEHLQDPTELAKLANRCQVKEVILSYPNKKTTHYNKHHLWDISLHDIKIIFADYHVLEVVEFYDSTFVHLAAGNSRREFVTKQWLTHK